MRKNPTILNGCGVFPGTNPGLYHQRLENLLLFSCRPIYLPATAKDEAQAARDQ